MPTAAPVTDYDLTPEMVELLRAGAAHPHGRMLVLRRDAETRRSELMEMERNGYLWWDGYDPIITEAGRAAIGAPTSDESRLNRLRGYAVEHAALRAKNPPSKPDPRSQRDYRVWNTMDLVCALVVKHRDKMNSIEISRDGSYYPHTYLPFSKMLKMPESTDEFWLVCMPKWLARRADLMGITLPLSTARPWLDEQRATWGRLGRLRLSINTRIHFAHKRTSNFTKADVA